MQVGLAGIVECKNHDEENGAAEPREIEVQEHVRFQKMFWREPVLLLWKVDQFWRHQGDNARDAKADAADTCGLKCEATTSSNSA
ncbi:MAG: hypothetical protein AUG46_12080 [Acidobacteria bacterium 13_1_20CM_3_58_11]|nr:MAG: hypothetical protein AUG46_12080 [Acidobacteria bacterium 13_1_20CM_3_58_11]